MSSTTFSTSNLLVVASLLTVTVFTVFVTDTQAAPVHADTEFKLVLRSDKLTNDFDEEADIQGERVKRSSDADDLDLAEFMDEAQAEGRHHQRSRRSAAWWLHATIQLCNQHSHLCKKIEVKEGNMRMEIRLETE